VSDNTRATLLERLRDGSDQLCWEEFFRCYWPSIYALAKRRGCSDQTAEEIVQDVMLKVFEQRDFYRYDPARGRFRNWLAALVRNRVAEYHRQPAQRVRARGGGTDAKTTHPPDDEATSDEEYEAAFEEALLPVLLDVVRQEVDPHTYLAFELLVLHELPGRDVSRITGLSRNAAYKARRRVMKHLGELTGQYRNNGRLSQRLKQALAARPAAVVQRSVTDRMDKSMRSM
jgi:RNA polymerase sigma-70 factor (ECF subfamily)